MKRSLLALALATMFVAAPAHAKLVELTASPNPAGLGDRVRYTVSVGGPVRIEAYDRTGSLTGGGMRRWPLKEVMRFRSVRLRPAGPTAR